MNVRCSTLDRSHDIQVGLTGVVGMDTSLHAHFSRAPVPGFSGAARDFLC